MKITRLLIEKYHQGLCTETEKQAVEAWLAGNDEDEQTPAFPRHINKSRAGERIWNNVRKSVLLKRKAFTNVRYLSGIAACFLLVIAVGYLLYSKHMGSETIANKEVVAKNVNPVYHTLTVGRGQKGSLTLPDSTVVVLNAESEITYPAVFTGNTREVKMAGEGYFHVTKNPSSPFIIHTPQTSITVLGTIFNVRAYASDNAASVVVKEGKVRFANTSGSQQLILTANQRGSYEYGHDMQKDAVDAKQYLLWMEDMLAFEDVPLQKVAAQLERWYNISIQIKTTQLQQQHFSGSFQNKTLDEVLNNICFVMGCHFSRRDDGVILLY